LRVAVGVVKLLKHLLVVAAEQAAYFKALVTQLPQVLL
jgi:hypothetical protein